MLNSHGIFIPSLRHSLYIILREMNFVYYLSTKKKDTKMNYFSFGLNLALFLYADLIFLSITNAASKLLPLSI